MKILVTGTAGFIGFHLAQRLVARGDQVTGIDNINDYYDQRVKYGRLERAGIDRQAADSGECSRSTISANYQFRKLDITQADQLARLIGEGQFDAVCHLAAQAGVRYSLTNPEAYIQANIVGFLNILEACRHARVPHLAYASSSSVYGLNARMPFSVHQNVDHPLSLYAASKKSNELMAHTYSHLYGLPTTGLRFFTVYGPWGRPDMALFRFVRNILEGRPIDVYNHGDMQRDFTYVDDIVEGLVRVIDHPAQPNAHWDPQTPDPATSPAPWRVYNIGNSSPVRLLDFIDAIECALNRKAERNLLPMQPGDVPSTWADVDDLGQDLGYRPSTSIDQGVRAFVEWYLEFYGYKENNH